MRVLMWHGWLLEGSGSNVFAAEVTRALRRSGHDVLLLCQADPGAAPEFVDEVGTVDAQGVSILGANAVAEPDPDGGRAVLLRPDIGSLLPVFVIDEYEGFEVKRFPDLSWKQLDSYLERNVAALRTAASWHRPDLVIASHLFPGGVVAARALRDPPFLVQVHGSDLEFAVRLQERYAELAREAMERAARIGGGSRDVLDRALAFAPSASEKAVVIAPGVDVDRFRPMPRSQALEDLAGQLEADPEAEDGRPAETTVQLASVMGTDPEGPERVARQYDQDAPDPDSAARLRCLARAEGPIVAYLGKLIPEKGVELFVQALALQQPDVHGLIVGFGLHREWLEGLVSALDGEADLDWIRAHSGLEIEPGPPPDPDAPKLSERIRFTGRLDHRYAPLALAAAEVLVVPSIIPEAFGMVAAEGAAAGCLPLVARHSGLAEVVEALEAHTGRPGLFGFQPGPGAAHRLAEGIRSILAIPPAERGDLRREVSSFARRTWTWDRTAEQLVAG